MERTLIRAMEAEEPLLLYNALLILREHIDSGSRTFLIALLRIAAAIGRILRANFESIVIKGNKMEDGRIEIEKQYK